MTTPQTAAELLAWYADAGVDIALLDEPVDRFEQTIRYVEEAAAAKLQSRTAATAAPNRGKTTQFVQPANIQRQSTSPDRAIPDSNAVALAQELAANAGTLEELRRTIEGFEGCNLKFTARTTVFSDGNPKAPIMLVGEAPGRDEDEQGLPFVGKSGQLLDKMLGAIGLDRTRVYISNICPWRPPGNRAPSPAETEICRPFIERHIELVEPQMLVLIGGSSSQTLLKAKGGIMTMRGKWTSVELGATDIPAMPILHPAYLLRNPAHKRLAWSDLLQIKARLSEISQSPIIN